MNTQGGDTLQSSRVLSLCSLKQRCILKLVTSVGKQGMISLGSFERHIEWLLDLSTSRANSRSVYSTRSLLCYCLRVTYPWMPAKCCHAGILHWGIRETPGQKAKAGHIGGQMLSAQVSGSLQDWNLRWGWNQVGTIDIWDKLSFKYIIVMRIHHEVVYWNDMYIGII